MFSLVSSKFLAICNIALYSVCKHHFIIYGCLKFTSKKVGRRRKKCDNSNWLYPRLLDNFYPQGTMDVPCTRQQESIHNWETFCVLNSAYFLARKCETSNIYFFLFQISTWLRPWQTRKAKRLLRCLVSAIFFFFFESATCCK